MFNISEIYKLLEELDKASSLNVLDNMAINKKNRLSDVEVTKIILNLNSNIDLVDKLIGNNKQGKTSINLLEISKDVSEFKNIIDKLFLDIKNFVIKTDHFNSNVLD